MILLRFHLSCQKLKNPCNELTDLKGPYLYNCSFKSYKQNTVGKLRRSTLLHLTSAKHDFHYIKCCIALSPKPTNIATVFEPTVSGITENVILWTPLLITLHQTDMVGP